MAVGARRRLYERLQTWQAEQAEARARRWMWAVVLVVAPLAYLLAAYGLDLVVSP